MLQFKELQKHYSQAENNLPRSVLKEYLQLKMLEIIFSSKYGSQLTFMGGTSIRIAYGSDRFSEDLDLDNHGLKPKDFADLMEIIKRELGREGVVAEIRNTFKDVYHCYLKFPNILFNNKLSPLRDEKILIQVDSYANKEKLAITTKVISKIDVFTELRVYTPDILLAQKMLALLNRKRAKGRDFYDVVYMFSLTDANWKYLKKHADINNFNDFIKAVKKKYKPSQMKDLAKDVAPFLINPKMSARVEKFFEWKESRK